IPASPRIAGHGISTGRTSVRLRLIRSIWRFRHYRAYLARHVSLIGSWQAAASITPAAAASLLTFVERGNVRQPMLLDPLQPFQTLNGSSFREVFLERNRADLGLGNHNPAEKHRAKGNGGVHKLYPLR